jgi:excisionase family DNA binding protein
MRPDEAQEQQIHELDFGKGTLLSEKGTDLEANVQNGTDFEVFREVGFAQWIKFPPSEGATVKSHPTLESSSRLGHPANGRPGHDHPTQLQLIAAVTTPANDARNSGDPEGGSGARPAPDPTAKVANPLRTDRLTMTVGEAAVLLGISRALAYELVARGEIPAIRLGHRIVVPTKRLQDLLLGGDDASRSSLA